MAVTVVSAADFRTHEYEDGRKWHIDEERQLHVVGDQGNIASYAGGCWVSVSKS